jgi:hypothetical protein
MHVIGMKQMIYLVVQILAFITRRLAFYLTRQVKIAVTASLMPPPTALPFEAMKKQVVMAMCKSYSVSIKMQLWWSKINSMTL